VVRVIRVAAINPGLQLSLPPKGTENINQDHLPNVKARARVDINEIARLQTRRFVESASLTCRASRSRNRLLEKA
jgi:hypothetical protein